MKSKISPAQFDEIKRRKALGESTPKLAAEYGIRRENLWRLLKIDEGGVTLGHAWKATITEPISAIDAAYLAGLFDGEGSLCFRREGVWLLRIGMTYEPVIRWLERIGGKVNAIPSSDKRPNRQPVWTWCVARQRDIHTVLTAMRPHLIVKAEKADAAIADLTERIHR